MLLADEAERLIVESALPVEHRGFNLDILYGAETTAGEVIDRSSSFPLGGDRRVVVVREAEKIPDRKILKDYLEHPAPTTTLVLSATRADFKEHPFLAAKEHAVLVALDPLRESEIPGWIDRRVRRTGRSIDPAAVQVLAARMRPSLQDIQNEIDKLLVFAGDARMIVEEDVLALVGDTREFNVFALQKAVAGGEGGRALAILHKLLEKPGEAVPMVAALFRFYGILWRLQDLQRKKTPADQVARELSVPPYFLREYTDALRRLAPGRVEEAIDVLTEADERLKSSGGTDEEIMTVLVVRLLGLQTQPTV
jgi:DNA polymerase-3 subunit delta